MEDGARNHGEELGGRAGGFLFGEGYGESVVELVRQQNDEMQGVGVKWRWVLGLKDLPQQEGNHEKGDD